METFDDAKVACDGRLTNGDLIGAKDGYIALITAVTKFIENLEVSPADETIQQATNLKRSLLNNLSMTYLKLEDNISCIETCTQCISLDTTVNLKSLYRRAQAYKAQGTALQSESFHKLALDDISQILSIEPLNAQAKALQLETRKARDDVQTAQKYAYAKESIANVPTSNKASASDKSKCSGDSSWSADGYSFMNPNWTPVETCASVVAPIPLAPAPAPQANPSSSMRALVAAARSNTNLSSNAATVSSLAKSSAGIESNTAVIAALSDLELQERELKRAVQDKVSMKGTGEANALLESSSVGNFFAGPKKKYTSTLRSTVDPSSLSAWEQLQQEEAYAESVFKTRLSRQQR